MIDVLEQAKSHFKSKLNTPRIIEVPEWGTEDEPLKIYVWPSNLMERDRIYQHVGSLESLVETVIVRAKDAEGKPLFKTVHRQELLREVDPDVLARIVTEMNNEEVTAEEAGKL